MPIPVYFLCSIIPAGLLLWLGTVIGGQQPQETASRRVFYFLLLVMLLFQIALLTVDSKSPSSLWSLAVIPIMTALIPILYLYWRDTPSLRKRRTVLIVVVDILVMFLLNIWFVQSRRSDSLVPILIYGSGFMIVSVWQVAQWRWLVGSLLVVLVLVVGADTFVYNAARATWSQALENLIDMAASWVFPIALVTLAGRLVYHWALMPHRENWRVLTAELIVAGLLLVLLTAHIAEVAMLDWATDGLGMVMILMALSVVAIAVTLLLAWTLKRRHLHSAVLYAGAMMAALVTIFTFTTRLDPQKVIVERAGQIDQAIQQYYQANGQYPTDLGDLVPHYLLYIPNPVLFHNQTWCYEGGSDYYRLGYVYRHDFNFPAESYTIQIQGSVGESSVGSWGCDAQLVEYRER